LVIGLALAARAVTIFPAEGQKTSLPLARAIRPDSDALQSLLDRMEDSNAAVRNKALSTLKQDGPQFLPGLDTALHRLGKRQMSAALALVTIGPPARDIIRRALIDTGAVAEAMSMSLSYMILPLDSALVWGLAGDSDPRVRAATVDVIGIRSDTTGLGQIVVRAFGDSSEQVRMTAVDRSNQLYFERDRRAVIPLLRQLLRTGDADCRTTVVRTLRRMRDVADPIIPDLVAHLNGDSVPEVRRMAARALGNYETHDPRVARALLIHAAREDSAVREESLVALGKLAVSQLPKTLADSILDSLDRWTYVPRRVWRDLAVHALSKLGAPAIVPLTRALRSPDDAVAIEAAGGLGALQDSTRIVAPLLAALSDSRADVSVAAADALFGAGDMIMPIIQSLARAGNASARRAAVRIMTLDSVVRKLQVVNHCYRIEYGRWSAHVPSTIEGVIPPVTLRFSRRQFRPSWKGDSVVKFIAQQYHDGAWHNSGFWTPDTTHEGVELDPNDAHFSGVSLTLHHVGIDLQGTIETHWDFKPETETAPVVARHMSCTAVPQGPYRKEKIAH